MNTCDSNEYTVIFDEKGDPLIDNMYVYLRNINSDEVLKTPLTSEIIAFFDLNVKTNDVQPTSSSNDKKLLIKEGQSKCNWSRDATLCLINLYKEHEEKFKSTTVTNDKVWVMISNKLNNEGFGVTASHCKDKMKYLKVRYAKKVDNMGPHSSGAELIKFDYFDEMDQIFGKKHRIRPPVIASSLPGTENTSSMPDNEEINVLQDQENKKRSKNDDFSTKLGKKRRKDPVENVLKEMREQTREKEENRNKRHEENLKVKNELINMLSSKLDAFLDKIK